MYSSGKLVAEYSTKVEPVETAKIVYTTTDHLGSPRVITDDLGNVRSRRDFMPFGEELYAGVGARTGDNGLKYSSSTDNVRQKFTGYQKDTETSLDFAEARMYENRFGRFTAVDPLLASGKSANPQSFNRFSYVYNNPMMGTDPDGRCPRGQCPASWRGFVYTKLDEHGNPRYNNEREDDSWTVFTGTARITDGTDNYECSIFSDGTAEGSGWGRIDPRLQLLIGGFNQGLDDIQSGSWTGVKNVPSTLSNTVTTLAFLPFGTIRSDQNGLPELHIPNPFLVQGYRYENERQARWGQQVTAAALIAPGVAAAPFTAGASFSVVPRFSAGLDSVEAGSFSIVDWTGYPSQIPKPAGPFRLLEGEEFSAARSAANARNKVLRAENPEFYRGYEIHEIKPVKFGGSPTSLANKIRVSSQVHRGQLTPFWNRLMYDLSK